MSIEQPEPSYCSYIVMCVGGVTSSGSKGRCIYKCSQYFMAIEILLVFRIYGILCIEYKVNVYLSAYEFWSVQDHENTRYNKRFDFYFGFSEYVVLRFSECLNPVFYNLGSTKMRRHTRRFIYGLFGIYHGSRRKSTTSTLSTSQSQSTAA